MEDLEETVDINTASVDEFVSRLKGVGRSKAKAIVHFRTTVGKFKKLCELTYVPGITQCILERNQGVLFCVSNSNNLSKLHEINKSESSLEEGELSESSFSLTGESEVDNRPRLNGQHLVVEQDNITRRTRNWSLTPDINGNDHHLALTIDTPCTAYQSFQDCTEEDSNMNSSPVIQSLRSRSKSRNEERTMSTRSRHTSNKSKADTAPESSTDSVGSRVDSLTLSSPRPNRGKLTRTKKTLSSEGLKADRITTRHMVERARPSMLSVTELRSGKHLLVNNPDTQTISVMVQSKSGEEFRMDTDNVEGESAGIASSSETVSKPVPSNKLLSGSSLKLMQLFSKRKRVLRSNADHQSQMKRKLDSRSDGCKLQSPEKKACKSSLSLLPSPNAPLPTFGEFKAVTRGIGIQNFYTDDKLSFESKESESGGEIVPVTNVRPKASIKVEGLAQWLQKFKNWNPAERIAALDELIDSCEPRQVRYMLEVIEPQFQRDFISLLPKELALYVLSFLEPKDLLTAAQTCRYWHILTEDNLLWREKCDEEGINEPYYPKVCKNSWKCRKPSAAIVQPSAWKSAFLRQHRIEMNWRRGEHKSVKLLKGHDDHVITCLQFNGTRIVSGSDDNTLKVWSAVSGKCLRTLTGHTGGVWASQMRKNMIISGSTDRTLKIWNVDSGQCIHTLYGHTSTVRCMALHDNIVVSGSRDATLRVWDVDTGECLHVLTGHMAAVRCVCYDGKLVVSGAYDYMVKVWDPVKEECLHTLQGHTNRVYSLQFDGVHVVSGSLDTSIRVWSVETGLCLHTLVGHQSLTSGMELKNNILVSGNADSTVKMWDIITGDCLKTLEGPNKHQSAVTCLQFYGKFVVTSSDDGTVKLWDVKSGKAIRDLVSLDSRGSGGVVWRIRASQTKLVCAVGSRNGTEETKLLVLDFDPDSKQ